MSKRVVVLLLALLVSVAPGLLSGATAAPTGPYVAASYYVTPVISVSSYPSEEGVYHVGLSAPEGSPPYTPSQIAEYYGFSSLWGEGYEGQGETIVIVDAFGSPTIREDLMVFDSYFGLPPAFLTVIRLPGQSNETRSDKEGWALETSLDVEWAHAMAPEAHIVLVEASSDTLQAMYQAVAFAVDHHLGQVISMSWGIPEPYELEVPSGTPGSIQAFHSLFEQAVSEGITPVASSGDEGAYNGLTFPNVNYPASDPYVLAVGGTNLTLGSSYGTTFSSSTSTAEYLWVDSGGGVSEYFSEPSWQLKAGITEVSTVNGAQEVTGRAVPDVAYAAWSPYGESGFGGLWIYDSTPYVISEGPGETFILSGWYGVGGTSCGAPQWSALVALLDQAKGYGYAIPWYSSHADPAEPLAAAFYSAWSSYWTYFNQIGYYENSYETLNNNGYYAWSPGWDAITGWGSPKAAQLASLI